MKKLQAAVLLAVWLAGPVAAQDFVTDVSNNGTVSAAFLEIGVGARAEAMGGAYASEAGRAEMIYWNPAGLAYLDGLSTTFTHTEWLADLTFDFFALAVPLPFFNTVLGTSFTTLGTPEQPVRTEFEPEGTGEVYDARDFAVNIALSARIIDAFSVGVTGKFIQQRIWSERGSQFALDAGVYYQTPFRGLTLGASISNFGRDISLSGKNLNNIIDPDLFNRGIENIPVIYKTDRHPLPQIFRFGLSYSASLAGAGSVVSTVNLMHPTGSTESINVGLEYGFMDLFFLRAGVQNLFERNAITSSALDGLGVEGRLTLGAGLHYRLRDRRRLLFDYAWTDWNMLQNVHRFSFGIYL
jgi:hypothetical protein